MVKWQIARARPFKMKMWFLLVPKLHAISSAVPFCGIQRTIHLRYFKVLSWSAQLRWAWVLVLYYDIFSLYIVADDIL